MPTILRGVDRRADLRLDLADRSGVTATRSPADNCCPVLVLAVHGGGLGSPPQLVGPTGRKSSGSTIRLDRRKGLRGDRPGVERQTSRAPRQCTPDWSEPGTLPHDPVASSLLRSRSISAFNSCTSSTLAGGVCPSSAQPGSDSWPPPPSPIARGSDGRGRRVRRASMDKEQVASCGRGEGSLDLGVHLCRRAAVAVPRDTPDDSGACARLARGSRGKRLDRERRAGHAVDEEAEVRGEPRQCHQVAGCQVAPELLAQDLGVLRPDGNTRRLPTFPNTAAAVASSIWARY